MQPTGVKVVKAASDLAPKGDKGPEHDVRKAKRVKYLNRVGKPRRLWERLDCSNPSCVVMKPTSAKGTHGTMGQTERSHRH